MVFSFLFFVLSSPKTKKLKTKNSKLKVKKTKKKKKTKKEKRIIQKLNQKIQSKNSKKYTIKSQVSENPVELFSSKLKTKISN